MIKIPVGFLSDGSEQRSTAAVIRWRKFYLLDSHRTNADPPKHYCHWGLRANLKDGISDRRPKDNLVMFLICWYHVSRRYHSIRFCLEYDFDPEQIRAGPDSATLLLEFNFTVYLFTTLC